MKKRLQRLQDRLDPAVAAGSIGISKDAVEKVEKIEAKKVQLP